MKKALIIACLFLGWISYKAVDFPQFVCETKPNVIPVMWIEPQSKSLENWLKNQKKNKE